MIRYFRQIPRRGPRCILGEVCRDPLARRRAFAQAPGSMSGLNHGMLYGTDALHACAAAAGRGKRPDDPHTDAGAPVATPPARGGNPAPDAHGLHPRAERRVGSPGCGIAAHRRFVPRLQDRRQTRRGRLRLRVPRGGSRSSVARPRRPEVHQPAQQANPSASPACNIHEHRSDLFRPHDAADPSLVHAVPRPANAARRAANGRRK